MKKAEIVWVTDECNGSKMCENCDNTAFKVVDDLAHPIGKVILKKNVVPDPDESEADKLVLIPDGVELILIPEGREPDYRAVAEECPYVAILTKKVELIDSVVNSDSPLQSS